MLSSRSFGVTDASSSKLNEGKSFVTQRRELIVHNTSSKHAPITVTSEKRYSLAALGNKRSQPGKEKASKTFVDTKVYSPSLKPFQDPSPDTEAKFDPRNAYWNMYNMSYIPESAQRISNYCPIPRDVRTWHPFPVTVKQENDSQNASVGKDPSSGDDNSGKTEPESANRSDGDGDSGNFDKTDSESENSSYGDGNEVGTSSSYDQSENSENSSDEDLESEDDSSDERNGPIEMYSNQKNSGSLDELQDYVLGTVKHKDGPSVPAQATASPFVLNSLNGKPAVESNPPVHLINHRGSNSPHQRLMSSVYPNQRRSRYLECKKLSNIFTKKRLIIKSYIERCWPISTHKC